MFLAAAATVLATAGIARAQAPDPAAPPDTTPPPVTSPASTPPLPPPPATMPEPAPAPGQGPVTPLTDVPPSSGGVEMAPEDAPPPPTPYVPTETVTSSSPVGLWRPHVGGALLLGGGYEDFTSSNVRSMTGGGGSWDARLVGGTRELIGVEAAYVGSARTLDTLTTNSHLVSNGVEGALRLNLPIVQGETLIEPFGFIGLGWQRYHVTSAPALSDVATNDDIMTMPVGGGLEMSYRMFMLDGRFTYRRTYMNDLFTSNANGGRLDTWGVGANAGVEF